MAEYIKREDAEEVVTHFMHSGGFSVADFIYAFGKIPVADVVERKKGKWIKGVGENGVSTSLFCSECNLENRHWYEWNYCPNCGADMRGET